MSIMTIIYNENNVEYDSRVNTENTAKYNFHKI